jgi:NAD(P)H-flavin reductase
MASSPEARQAERGADAMSTAAWPVRRVVRETDDTFSLVLDPPGAAAFPFQPGQFNMLYDFGVGEVPISISGDPARSEHVVHTVRAVGTVTRSLRRRTPGELVGIRGPYGSAWPVDQAHGHDLVVVAGGIGLAPLRPALYHVLAHRGLYGRVTLLYGARTPRDLLYTRELREWRGRFDMDVEVTVDRATVDWQGGVGVVTKLVARAPFDPGGAIAFVCGPEVMIRFAAMAFEARGVAPRSVFVSLERNMKCGVGLCGHCQFGPHFVCREGPVFRYDQVRELLALREV